MTENRLGSPKRCPKREESLTEAFQFEVNKRVAKEVQQQVDIEKGQNRSAKRSPPPSSTPTMDISKARNAFFRRSTAKIRRTSPHGPTSAGFLCATLFSSKVETVPGEKHTGSSHLCEDNVRGFATGRGNNIPFSCPLRLNKLVAPSHKRRWLAVVNSRKCKTWQHLRRSERGEQMGSD